MTLILRKKNYSINLKRVKSMHQKFVIKNKFTPIHFFKLIKAQNIREEKKQRYNISFILQLLNTT